MDIFEKVIYWYQIGFTVIALILCIISYIRSKNPSRPAKIAGVVTIMMAVIFSWTGVIGNMVDKNVLTGEVVEVLPDNMVQLRVRGEEVGEFHDYVVELLPLTTQVSEGDRYDYEYVGKDKIKITEPHQSSTIYRKRKGTRKHGVFILMLTIGWSLIEGKAPDFITSTSLKSFTISRTSP